LFNKNQRLEESEFKFSTCNINLADHCRF
jgi:hypothetical protein